MKNKMNKTMKFLSMAALALVGTVMTGCSNDDIMDIEQPGNDNVERLTVVANLDGSTTRALTNEGVKTYAVGDKIAVVYKNTSGNTVKAESDALAAGDITGSGKSAKFTVTLVNADKTKAVTYIYPAYMAKENGTVNYDALYKEQDGTLETLGKKFDYCTDTDNWNDGKLPAADLTNQLFVCEFTLKYSGASINDKVTAMTISDNATHNYYVNIDRTPSSDPIYVAIIPTASNNINYTAIADGKVYTKSVTNKTYAAGAMRPIHLNMDQNNDLVPGLFSIGASKKVYFSKGNLQATYDGSSWTWKFADHQYDYVGNAAANTSINGNGTISSNGTVDLFGWVGASSTWTDEAQYGISNSTSTDNTSGYGNSATESLKSDWGSNIGEGWYTLSKDEWMYLFNTRTVNGGKGSGKSYTVGQKVNNVLGVVLYPDDYTGSAYTGSDWATFESAGCVFLPAAGYRDVSTVSNDGSNGCYWSSSPYYALNVHYAYNVNFDSGSLSPASNSTRRYGYSVRLVRKVE